MRSPGPAPAPSPGPALAPSTATTTSTWPPATPIACPYPYVDDYLVDGSGPCPSELSTVLVSYLQEGQSWSRDRTNGFQSALRAASPELAALVATTNNDQVLENRCPAHGLLQFATSQQDGIHAGMAIENGKAKHLSHLWAERRREVMHACSCKSSVQLYLSGALAHRFWLPSPRCQPRTRSVWSSPSRACAAPS